ncbi:MAG: hypothetical protein ACYTG1_11120, partial [Planctomycetota bacterium]
GGGGGASGGGAIGAASGGGGGGGSSSTGGGSGPARAPFVYDAIYYGHYRSPNAPDYALGQGAQTAAVRDSLGIGIIPMVYGHDIDRNTDGVISEVDRALMVEWLDEFVPADFSGPICLDYEHPFNVELNLPAMAPTRLAEILEVYEEVLDHAQAQRSVAKWGFWNIPMRRHLSEGWAAQGLSVTGLLEQCDAIFPAPYDCQPDVDDGPAFQQYISDALEAVQGERPVYVFLNVRYCAQNDGYQSIIPAPVILSNAESCLLASWTAPDGQVHRPAGLVLWDCYCYAPESTWGDIDVMHAALLTGMHELARRHGFID